MDKVDLHLHTTSSDGLLTPKEVVEAADKKKVKAIAITDHDTIDGIDEALEAGKELGITVVPGIELSCIYKEEEIHILGYYIDRHSKSLNSMLVKIREKREQRGYEMVRNLKSLGIGIEADEVALRAKNGNIGRPHIARVLVEKGVVDTIEEAFEKYLVKGRSGYAERYKISVEDAIELIHQAGGVAVMAHPGIVKRRSYPKEILKYPIDGIEVIHSKHSDSVIREYGKIVKKLGLIETAGSDCHGVVQENGELMIGEYTTGMDVIDKLREKGEYYGKRTAEK